MIVSRLSEEAKKELWNTICDGLKRFVENDPDSLEYLLDDIIDNFLEPISQDDGFGTEGWEHAFGWED